MPDPNLQSYLATHYLSGPKADAILARSPDGKVKRKKKKQLQPEPSSSSSGLVFKDDSDSWKSSALDAEDDEAQVVGQSVAGPSSRAFRKIGSASRPDSKRDTVVGEAKEEPVVALKAGLRSKEEMRAARLAREEQKRRASSPPPAQRPQEDEEDEEARLAQTTVYRNSSGRVIDTTAADAAEALAQRQRDQKAAERATWSQGLVQRSARTAAASELASVRDKGVARRATDEDYNKHFKDQLRADDPALAFLTKKRVQGPQKPKYKGPWPPNRYGIAPGYRWDGVDRGNGFEKRVMERKAELARRDNESRAWGQADM